MLNAISQIHCSMASVSFQREIYGRRRVMAVLKNKTKRDNFLVVSKIFLQDQGLSLMERGLLATMHSLPDDWEFTIMGMEKILPDGKYKIKVALDGLVKKGYVSKVQIKDSNGKFGRNVIEVNERPLTKIPLAEKPLTDNPLTGKPPAGNQSQYNNNKYSIEECNNNQSINQSDSDSMDRQKDIKHYKELIADNIKLDWLLEVAGRNSESEVAMVNEIYDVICDMVCYPRDSVTIKNTQYPWQTVKSQFLKLRYQHIADVLNRIVDAELGIRNMSAYLVSTLYTASLVGTIEAEANMHDDYLKYLRGKPY